MHEFREMLKFSSKFVHPLAIRYPRSGVNKQSNTIAIESTTWEHLESGDGDFIIIASGERALSMAYYVRHSIENIGKKVSVFDLAEHSGVNITTLERHFYSVFRITPAEYIKKRRLNDSAQLLKNGISVTDACFECGFSDLSKYISSFKKQFGVTPKQYQKENFKKT